jgi:predicted RNase H-like nuclease (RuvC/YqgF family)
MGSTDEYSSDNGGRKRKPVYNEGEVFGNSMKTPRTPGKYKNDEKLDLLIQMIKELKSDSQQIKTEQEECREEIRKIREENKILWQEKQELKKENKELKEKFSEISDKVEWLEKQKRKNNIVMQGLKIDIKDAKILKEAIENIIKKELELDIAVKTVQKIGEKTCLIELEKEEDKENIMKNKYKLKYKENDKIYINNDETKKERERGRQIRKMAKEEKNKGKEVKTGYNKVTIEGKVWKWNRALEKLELEQPKN